MSTILDDLQADRARAIAAQDQNAQVCFLATVDSENCPAVRTLVLREISDRQLTLFINASSPKLRHIQHQPHCQVLIWYPSIQIQYRLSGKAALINTDDIKQNWHKRPVRAKVLDHFYDQLAGQSTEFASRERFLEAYQTLYDGIDTKALEATDAAIGLAITTTEIERLDLSQNDLPHDRSKFTWQANAWQKSTLVP